MRKIAIYSLLICTMGLQAAPVMKTIKNAVNKSFAAVLPKGSRPQNFFSKKVEAAASENAQQQVNTNPKASIPASFTPRALTFKPSATFKKGAGLPSISPAPKPSSKPSTLPPIASSVSGPGKYPIFEQPEQSLIQTTAPVPKVSTAPQPPSQASKPIILDKIGKTPTQQTKPAADKRDLKEPLYATPESIQGQSATPAKIPTAQEALSPVEVDQVFSTLLDIHPRVGSDYVLTQQEAQTVLELKNKLGSTVVKSNYKDYLDNLVQEAHKIIPEGSLTRPADKQALIEPVYAIPESTQEPLYTAPESKQGQSAAPANTYEIPVKPEVPYDLASHGHNHEVGITPPIPPARNLTSVNATIKLPAAITPPTVPSRTPSSKTIMDKPEENTYEIPVKPTVPEAPYDLASPEHNPKVSPPLPVRTLSKEIAAANNRKATLKLKLAPTSQSATV